MLAARLAQIRGAKQVIVIDNVEYRLSYVQEKVTAHFCLQRSHQFLPPQGCIPCHNMSDGLHESVQTKSCCCGRQVPGVEVVNFDKHKDVVAKLKEMTTHGPDVGIEAGDNLLVCFIAHLIQQTAQTHCKECCSWMPLHQELDSQTGNRTATGDRFRRHDQ